MSLSRRTDQRVHARGWVVRWTMWGGLLLILSGPVGAEDALPAQIDASISAAAPGPLAPRCDDAAFCRRIYLDLAGRIPSSAELGQFLDDADPARRDRLIDRLLAGPDYPQRMAESLHVMLMERGGDHAEWFAWLQDSCRQNKPWDRMVAEILGPQADDASRRGAAWFLSRRLENYGQQPVDMPGLARDIGRMFLGLDLQCAQCHNHLFVNDYKQSQFQGLFAFVSHTSLRRDVTFPAVAESVVAKPAEFMSVFDQQKLYTGPRVPGLAEVSIPTFGKGEEFLLPPDSRRSFSGIPRFSPLRILAEQLPSAENRQFARNAVNRFWFLMMGRGLVHPLDLHHGDNPASHPQVLEALTDGFLAHGFDIRWLLAQLARTETYQRSSELPVGMSDPPLTGYQVALEKPLSAEQIFASLAEATGLTEIARAEIETQRTTVDPRHGELCDMAPGLRTQLLHAKLATARAAFITAFANPPREPEVEFAPSVKAALFLSNDATLLGWLNPQPGNLIDRLTKLDQTDQIADQMYLATLSRLPSAEERTFLADYCQRHAADRPQALARFAWALLASSEFCLNH